MAATWCGAPALGQAGTASTGELEISARVMYDALVESEADLADTARFRRQRLSADWTRGPVRMRGQAEFSGDERFVELYAYIDLPY